MVTVHERELLRSRQVARKAIWESMMTEGGMTIVVHPAAVNAGAHGWVCDNYLVTNTGASACLHKTEQKIFAV